MWYKTLQRQSGSFANTHEKGKKFLNNITKTSQKIDNSPAWQSK